MKASYSLLLFIALTSITAKSQTKFTDIAHDLFAYNDTVKNKKGEILQEVVVLSQQ